MTHLAPRKRGGKTWILPGLAVAVIAGLAVIGVLSQAIAIDFASWWPAWLILLVAGLMGRDRKLGRLRVGGLVSVVSVAALALFVFAHLQGWALIPSAAGVLSGSPETEFESAGLSARVPDGELIVGSGTPGTLYSVEALRRGGSVAVPFAVERSQDGDVSVVLTPSEDPGLFVWNGWDLRLSTAPTWTLTLEGRIDADLIAVEVENLQLAGSGSVHLGSVVRSTPVTVSGDFVIEVPAGVPVRVVGVARIPPDWTRSDTGSASPAPGNGWVISVADGSTVEIRVR